MSFCKILDVLHFALITFSKNVEILRASATFRLGGPVHADRLFFLASFFFSRHIFLFRKTWKILEEWTHLQAIAQLPFNVFWLFSIQNHQKTITPLPISKSDFKNQLQNLALARRFLIIFNAKPSKNHYIVTDFTFRFWKWFAKTIKNLRKINDFSMKNNDFLLVFDRFCLLGAGFGNYPRREFNPGPLAYKA